MLSARFFMKKYLYADYGKRLVSLVFGLVLCGIGSYIVSRAQAIGIGAWETLQVGMNLCTGMSYGTACIVVGYGIIVLDLLMKGKIGFGSLLNAYLVGATCNFIEAYVDIVPKTDSVILGVIYIIIAYVIQLTGCVYYIKAALGCGPRDTLNVLLGYHFPKVKISIVRFFLDLTALIAGVLMGAPFGIGTVAAMGLRTLIMQVIYDAFRFEPRKVVHENVIDTVKILAGKMTRDDIVDSKQGAYADKADGKQKTE